MPIRTVVRPRLSVETENVAYQCNVCGVEEMVGDLGQAPYDMHVISLGGGWGDRFPGELEHITLVVHGSCLKSWCDTFKVPVESKWVMGNTPTIQAIHSETGKPVILKNSWVRDPDMPAPDFRVEDPYTLPFSDLIPHGGVFEHFKGGLYQVLDHGWDVREPHEAYVIYQALYGESLIFARPARMWNEQVEREDYIGPRFRLPLS